MNATTCQVLCIGAGPAGLTAAYLLSKNGVDVTVLEKDPRYVGGISRTVNYKNYLCDIGGHRFFSKSAEVEALWEEILGDDFIFRHRKSRIYYQQKFFDYPLRAFDSFSKLGFFTSFACLFSYLKARLFPYKKPANFREWIINRFGNKLFSIFFQTYTEKVWGMPCAEISADWAAQRIKGLSLSTAILNALGFGAYKKNKKVKTLIDSFRYPRRGPGMMWERAAEKITQQGGQVLMQQEVVSCEYQAEQKSWLVSTKQNGEMSYFRAEHIISSMPLSQLAIQLVPVMQAESLQAAKKLKYRDFLIVALIVRETHRFDDNWLYIHEPDVKVGRIQNFKSWSPEMVPDLGTNCYGMEYFCFENDALWLMDDKTLVAFATKELVELNLALPQEVLDGFVIRQPKAYPVYDANYQDHVQLIKKSLEKNYPGLHPVGRNGLHRYNNQDHSMMTAMLTVKNIMAGETLYDIWQVNEDAEYHEEVKIHEKFS